MIRVAAYQAPLLEPGSMEAIAPIREQVQVCETRGVRILCCPEAVLGGLADDSPRPEDIAIDVEGGQLDDVLGPLASDTVTTIVGFTEIDRAGRLYNSAAIHHCGVVVGRYRKLHPAIRRSVYDPGDEVPVFTAGGLTFGVVICRDSSFPEPARIMASRGATALFVPTNNGLPPGKGGPDLVRDARADDVARATENGVWVIRADVAGTTTGLVSYGSSAIVAPDGSIRRSASPLTAELVVAEIEAGTGRWPGAAQEVRVTPGGRAPSRRVDQR